MAKIQPNKTNKNKNKHKLIYGDSPFADISQMGHIGLIRNGYETETQIINFCNPNIVIKDLTEFVKGMQIIPEGTYICSKKALNYKTFFVSKQPDFLVFKIGKNRKCKITEMKNGYDFDTKKSQGELKTLKECCLEFKNNVKTISGNTIDVDYQICSFDATTKQQIVNGFKGKIPKEHCITGKSFCNNLGIDYEKIILQKQNDVNYNIDLGYDEMFSNDNYDWNKTFSHPNCHRFLKEQGLMICKCV